jgi:hypothetical protein
MRTLRRPSPATLIAMLALFVALAESSFAEPVRSAATRLISGSEAPGEHEGGAGLCGTGGANWISNEWGSTTALVLK